MFVRRLQQKSQDGAAMLVVLLLLAAFVLIGFTLASLTYRGLKIARMYEDSLQSFYASETGIERALDITQLGRVEGETLDDTIMEIENYAAPAGPVSLSSGVAEYYIDDVATSDTIDSLTVPVPTFRNTQIDLYDPDAPFTTYMNIESAQFYWNEPDCPVDSNFEVSWYEFDDEYFDMMEDAVSKQVFTCVSGAGDWDCEAISNVPVPNTNYIARLKALECAILGMNITFYDAADAGGSVEEIPSGVKVVSIGEAQQSQRRMISLSQWKPSASGLVDFVLFSIEDIVK